MLVKKKGKVSFVCRTQNGCSTGPISFLWVKLTYFRSQKMFSHDHTTKIEFWGKSWNSCIESGTRWALTGPGSVGPGPSLSGRPRPDKKLFFLKCLKMISGGGKCVRNLSKPSKTPPEVICERIHMPWFSRPPVQPRMGPARFQRGPESTHES